MATSRQLLSSYDLFIQRMLGKLLYFCSISLENNMFSRLTKAGGSSQLSEEQNAETSGACHLDIIAAYSIRGTWCNPSLEKQKRKKREFAFWNLDNFWKKKDVCYNALLLLFLNAPGLDPGLP